MPPLLDTLGRDRYNRAGIMVTLGWLMPSYPGKSSDNIRNRLIRMP